MVIRSLILVFGLPLMGAVFFGRTEHQEHDPITLSSVKCSGCAIDLKQAVRLGDDSGPATVERTDVIARRGNGDYVLHLQFDPGFLSVFHSDGTFGGRIGRQGQGPGEFQTIQEVISFGKDELIAFDYQNQRASIVGVDGETVKTIPIRGVLPDQTGVVAFPSDSLLVINRHIRTPDRVGYPLHLVDFNGDIRASFGAPKDVEVDIDEKMYRRRLAESPDGSVWAASLRYYVLDQWSREGLRLKSYERHPNWFVIEDPIVPISPEGGRYSEVMDVDFDAQRGHLWVLIQVPSLDDDWASGLISEEYGGRREYGPGDYSKIYDTMVEVIDVRDNRLIASQRFGPAFRRFVGERMISSFGSDPTSGAEFIDVWHVRLVQPGRIGW